MEKCQSLGNPMCSGDSYAGCLTSQAFSSIPGSISLDRLVVRSVTSAALGTRNYLTFYNYCATTEYLYHIRYIYVQSRQAFAGMFQEDMERKLDRDTNTAGGDIHQEFNPEEIYNNSHNGEQPMDLNEVYRGNEYSPSIHLHDAESTNLAEMEYIQRTYGEYATKYIEYLQEEKRSNNLRSFVYRSETGLNHRSRYHSPILSKNGIFKKKNRDRVPGERSNSLLGIGADGRQIESVTTRTGYISPIDRGYEERTSDSPTSPISPLDLAAFPLPPDFEHEHANTLPLQEDSEMDVESLGGPTSSLTSDTNPFADFDGDYAPASPQYPKKDSSFWSDVYDEFEEEVAKQEEAQSVYGDLHDVGLSTECFTPLLETASQELISTDEDKSAVLVDAQYDYGNGMDEIAEREKDQGEHSDQYDAGKFKRFNTQPETLSEQTDIKSPPRVLERISANEKAETNLLATDADTNLDALTEDTYKQLATKVRCLEEFNRHLEARAIAAEDCAEQMDIMLVKLNREVEALERSECHLIFEGENCAREKAHLKENETNLLQAIRNWEDRITALDQAHKYARNTMNSLQVENTKLNTQLDNLRKACQTPINHSEADSRSIAKAEKENAQLVLEIDVTRNECKLLKGRNEAAVQRIQKLEQEKTDESNALVASKRKLVAFRTGCRTLEEHFKAEGQTVLKVQEEKVCLLPDDMASHGKGHMTEIVQGTTDFEMDRTEKDVMSAIQKRIAYLRTFWSKSENLPRIKPPPRCAWQTETGNTRIEEMKEEQRLEQEEWQRLRVEWWAINGPWTDQLD